MNGPFHLIMQPDCTLPPLFADYDLRCWSDNNHLVSMASHIESYLLQKADYSYRSGRKVPLLFENGLETYQSLVNV